jgi:glutathione-regulated potassium-efflux system ancillary protein KefG
MEPQNTVLILFGHPALRRSRVNRVLVDAVRDLAGVTVHDLYETYPELDIDVPREQRLLSDHGIVVFQHPFYWYSTPAIFKEWQDLVLEHGWAYGHEGRALSGKTLLNAVTAGGREESYCQSGSNTSTVRQLLAPIEQTARLCGMDYLPPFVVYGTHGLTTAEIDRHATDYRRTVEALRDGLFDVEAARGWSRLNRDLDAVIGG